MASIQPEPWVTHAESLRRMARALVGDEDESEDVVQNAYLVALRQPSSWASRGWRERVLRSRAFDVLRRRRARREYESLAATEREVNGADVIAERLELHRVLVEAVGGLREPYQRVVFLRYFEDLGPTEIAAELGVPVKTVKTRLHRALAELRERLERRLGTGRDGWRPALAALAPRGRTSLAVGTLAASVGGMGIMTKKIAIVAVLAVALLGVSRFWQPAVDAVEPETGALPGVAGTEIVAPTEEAPVAPVERDERTLASGGAGPAEEAAVPSAGTLVVRVLWPDREPAADVGVDVRLAERGRPSTGLARVVSDRDGIARVEGLAPGKVSIKSDREGRAEADVVAGAETEVEFVLPVGVDVAGRVVDGSGAPVVGADVWLSTGYTDWQGGRFVTRSDDAGAFQVRQVPKDQSLGATAPGRSPSALVDLETVDTSRDPVVVELVIEDAGGGLRGVVLRPDGSPAAGAWVSAGDTPRFHRGRLGQGQAESWTPRSVRCDDAGRFAVAGLSPGEAEIQARDDGCSIWKGAATVRESETTELEIQLLAGVVVEGVVRDGAGEPVPGAIVRGFDGPIDEHFLQGGQFDYESAFGYPSTAADDAGRYRLEEVAVGEVHLYAHGPRERRVPGVARKPFVRDHEVFDTSEGERIEWDPVLDPGHTLKGIVTYRDGHPMPHHFVSARNEVTGASQALTTGQDGRFEFVNMQLVSHTLGVQLWNAPPDAAPVEATNVMPGEGEIRLIASFDKPVEEEAAEVKGRVVDAGERLVDRGAMQVLLESDQKFWRVGGDVGEDRAFHFEGVVPGRYKVLVLAGDAVVLVGEWFELAPGEVRDLGALPTEPGGSAEIRLERPEGTEAAEPRIWLKPEGTIHGVEIQIGTDSERLVENLSPGEYRISMYGTGMLPVEATVTVVAGEVAIAECRLEPAVARAFELWFEEGRPMGPLTVSIVDDEGRSYWDSEETNTTFLTRPYTRSPQLPIGRFTLTAETGSGMKGSATFEVVTLEPGRPAVRVDLR